MLNWLPSRNDAGPLKVLCLGAHSDDIEIGCGASLMKIFEDCGDVEVRWTVYSGGGIRAEEARSSAVHWLQHAGAQQIGLHEFKDGFFPEAWAGIKEEFEQIKAEYSPDLIFTHYRKDLHQDHRVINELTWNTFRNHCILEYEIPKYDGDLSKPNFFVPVSEAHARDKAKALMSFFGTQQSRHWFSEELFLGLMRIRGMECCSESGYAEGFHARKICM